MAKENKNSIIKTENLSIGYSSKKENHVVASSVDLKLNKGELIGLVGTNGIGKSTLLRTLTKVQKPLSGTVLLNGKDLNSLTPQELAQTLSLVLTEQPISKNLSVAELVALGRQPYTNWVGTLKDEDKNKVKEALTLVNISDLAHKKCYELSDGQLQKAMIARALAQDTQVIILDEPTTHLDMYHKAYVLKLLQKLTKETRKTILFSSHEVDLTIQLCDSMIVMTNNNVVCDTPCNLITNKTFENLFPKDLITFDEKTGSFRVKK